MKLGIDPNSSWIAEVTWWWFMERTCHFHMYTVISTSTYVEPMHLVHIA